MHTKFMTWQFLWLKVIAKAWAEPDAFGKNLIDPKQEAQTVIEGAFNFPWRGGWWPLPSWVRLQVKSPPDAFWVSGKELWALPPAEIVWRIKAPPARNASPAAAIAEIAENLAEFETDTERTQQLDALVAELFAKRDRQLIEKMRERSEVIGQSLAEPREQFEVAASHEYVNIVNSVTTLVMQKVITDMTGIAAGGATPASLENPLTAFDQMVRWLRVWPRVVARAWKDPTGFGDYLQKAPVAALETEFKLKVPHDTKLTVRYEVDERKELDEIKDRKQHEERKKLIDSCYPPGRPPHVDLVMILPHAPQASDQAVAMASYFESGRSNPFTAITC
jgi:hypothetical protein